VTSALAETPRSLAGFDATWMDRATSRRFSILSRNIDRSSSDLGSQRSLTRFHALLGISGSLSINRVRIRGLWNPSDFSRLLSPSLSFSFRRRRNSEPPRLDRTDINISTSSDSRFARFWNRRMFKISQRSFAVWRGFFRLRNLRFESTSSLD